MCRAMALVLKCFHCLGLGNREVVAETPCLAPGAEGTVVCCGSVASD